MGHFEVGKKVIAIKNHVEGIYKRGNVFELKGIKKSPCGCTHIDLDVGLKTNVDYLQCSKCKYLEKSTGIHWCGETHFAPYDDSLSELTVEDILTEKANA